MPGNADGVGVLAVVSWIAASIALRGCVAGAWSSKPESTDGLTSVRLGYR